MDRYPSAITSAVTQEIYTLIDVINKNTYDQHYTLSLVFGKKDCI